VASVVGLQAEPSQFCATFDGLITVTARPCAYISRLGRFRANNNRRTTLPLAHARGVINCAHPKNKLDIMGAA
jgi:Holliday junction resolvasome RuvABC endonuclease subunit